MEALLQGHCLVNFRLQILRAQSLENFASIRMTGNLPAGDLTCTHRNLADTVVIGEILQPSIVKMVQAGISHMTPTCLIAGQIERHHCGFHLPGIGAAGDNLPIGCVQLGFQFFLCGKDGLIPGQSRCRNLGGIPATAVTAQAIAYRSKGILRINQSAGQTVLVYRTVSDGGIMIKFNLHSIPHWIWNSSCFPNPNWEPSARNHCPGAIRSAFPFIIR